MGIIERLKKAKNKDEIKEVAKDVIAMSEAIEDSLEIAKQHIENALVSSDCIGLSRDFFISFLVRASILESIKINGEKETRKSIECVLDDRKNGVDAGKDALKIKAIAINMLEKSMHL